MTVTLSDGLVIHDLSTWSADDLNLLSAALGAEQRRRSFLTQIPAQVASLANTYLISGGSLDDVLAAVQSLQDIGSVPVSGAVIPGV